jgi:spore coat protein U-like protein
MATTAHAAMTCTITSTSGVKFGSYDSRQVSPLDSTGLVAYRCENVTAADRVMIHLSRGDSGRYLPRAMLRRGFRLEYNLFLDAARTLVWGDGTSGTSAYSARPANGDTTSVTIYGRIPPRQNVRPDVYGDVIIVTVLY